MRSTRRTIVAVPVHNEADRIAACLEALDGQIGAQLDDIVLLLNNCTDRSVDIARRVTLHGIKLHCIEVALPPERANAGHARRLALQAAARLADSSSVLLTTDADARVDPDWLAANLAALAAGADVVAGWVELDPVEWGQIPCNLHEDDARECAYDALCDEIHARLDPDPADPWPRHTQHSGASIALTMAAYRLTDGVPDVASGEDRAFIAELRREGARIRHAPEVHVVVSGRTDGRSVGGMADTIRRRMQQQDDFIDDRLEPACACVRRAFFRGQMRRAYRDPALFDELARRLKVTDLPVVCSSLNFEAAWDLVEQSCWLRDRRLVRLADLAQETATAAALLSAIRSGSFDPGDRSDSPRFEPARLG